LITCGEQRAALACVRSLGRAGHEIWVVSSHGRSLAGASRYARREIACGDPLRDPGGYRAAVARLVGEAGVEVVIPVTEPALLALLAAPDALAPARIPFPDLATFERVSDKAAVMAEAHEVGIAVPRQVVLASADDASTQLSRHGETPAVLKPARSVHRGTKLAVSYVDAGEDVWQRAAALPEAAFPLLVQQRVVGPGTGVFLLRWGGQTHAAFAHRRIREKPPSGGVSVLRESIALDPALEAAATALLDRLGWNGVAMVEFKVDAATGVPYLMEINGRFWGSLQLAIDAGVDFPRLLVEAAAGAPPPKRARYRLGVRSRWLLGDLDHLLLRLTRSRSRLDLPEGAPGRVATLFGFLRAFLPPNRHEVLRWNDPRPFAREVRAWVAALGR
jgi:predicted ATP-grasp superfamily ATP-dependent carboligase